MIGQCQVDPLPGLPHQNPWRKPGPIPYWSENDKPKTAVNGAKTAVKREEIGGRALAFARDSTSRLKFSRDPRPSTSLPHRAVATFDGDLVQRHGAAFLDEIDHRREKRAGGGAEEGG